MTAFKLAVLDLSRKPVSFIITIFSISISVACCGMLVRLISLSQSRFQHMGLGGDAIVGAKSGGIEILLGALNNEVDRPGYLPNTLFETLKSKQNISFEDGASSSPAFLRQVIPILYFGTFQGARLIGTDESFINRINPEDNFHFQKGRWANGIDEVVLGSEVATRLNLKVGDLITVNASFKIVGVFLGTGTTWDRQIYSNIQTAQVHLSQKDLKDTSIWGSKVLNYFLVYLTPQGFPGLSGLINGRTVAQAISVDVQRKNLEALSGSGEYIGFLFVLLILLLSAMSVAATLITRFESMSLQMAVLRAIGYPRQTLGFWLFWEGLIISVFSCAIGGLADLIFFPGVRGLLGRAIPETVESSIFISSPIWIVAIFATTVSVGVPLARMYKQDVHTALKS